MTTIKHDRLSRHADFILGLGSQTTEEPLATLPLHRVRVWRGMPHSGEPTVVTVRGERADAERVACGVVFGKHSRVQLRYRAENMQRSVTTPGGRTYAASVETEEIEPMGPGRVPPYPDVKVVSVDAARMLTSAFSATAELSSFGFSKAALENIEECGVDYTTDLAQLRANLTTEEALLAKCLDGADEDRHEGWREYVAALVAVV